MTKNKSLLQITQIIKKFEEDRGWNNYKPNDLLASVYIELGELAEHFQWQSDFGKVKNYTDEEKEQLGFEFVDVLSYLLSIAEKSNIDIEKYFDLKMPRLEKKFPAGITNEEISRVKKEYRKSGKNKNYK